MNRNDEYRTLPEDYDGPEPEAAGCLGLVSAFLIMFAFVGIGVSIFQMLLASPLR